MRSLSFSAAFAALIFSLGAQAQSLMPNPVQPPCQESDKPLTFSLTLIEDGKIASQMTLSQGCSVTAKDPIPFSMTHQSAYPVAITPVPAEPYNRYSEGITGSVFVQKMQPSGLYQTHLVIHNQALAAWIPDPQTSQKTPLMAKTDTELLFYVQPNDNVHVQVGSVPHTKTVSKNLEVKFKLLPQ